MLIRACACVTSWSPNPSCFPTDNSAFPCIDCVAPWRSFSLSQSRVWDFHSLAAEVDVGKVWILEKESVGGCQELQLLHACLEFIPSRGL